MTQKQFFDHIQGEITAGGALPVVIEEKELLRIEKQASMWFYENWLSSVEQQHYVIKKSQFNNEIFKKTRKIDMPECVVTVFECKEINGVGRLGNIDRDFAEDRLIASEIFLSHILQ